MAASCTKEEDVLNNPQSSQAYTQSSQQGVQDQYIVTLNLTRLRVERRNSVHRLSRLMRTNCLPTTVSLALRW
jgi:hypothetical protein